MLSKDLFEPKRIGAYGPISQISIIAMLYATLTLKSYFEAKSASNLGPTSTFAVSLLFVPIYEEVLFRGVLLGYVENITTKLRAVIIVSLLFGLWHLKNLIWFDTSFVIKQILYTGFIFSPLMCALTLKTRSVWPAVILHYCNNLVF